MLIDNFHTFSYNGRRLADLGAVIRQHPRQIFSVPDFNLVKAPYKNGDIIEDNIRFKNVEFKIPIRALPPLCNMEREEFAYSLTSWLLSGKREYKIYRDTYNMGYFRYGIVTNIKPVEEVERNVFETEITINFKPFLYSDVGANVLEYTTSGNSISKTIVNPELWDSEPLITVEGAGTFTITVNSLPTVTVISTAGFTIDKPEEDVYTLTKVSCNDKVTGLALPYFQTGTNTISIARTSGTGDWKAKIVPNWRRS